MKGIRKLCIAAAAASTLASAPVSAACLADKTVEAAFVRDLDAMLMVSTLRCRVQGVEMSADYNKFVREKRVVLTAANDELRAHFALGRGSKAGLDAYDRYATSLANSHGAGSAAHDCADMKSLVQAAVAAAPSRGALLALAAQAGVNPILPAETCATRQIALAR